MLYILNDEKSDFIHCINCAMIGGLVPVTKDDPRYSKMAVLILQLAMQSPCMCMLIITARLPELWLQFCSD